ncbi:MAG TPA: aspartate kinase [Longimicrobiaceae bacterium]|nr:aspartate kinase [Longimicrobiaceae bacterium]
MPLIVQKYGGTSLGSAERIRAVARLVVEGRRRGDDIVVVVSAMGHTTDELLERACEVIGKESVANDHPRELDMLLTAGERISMALLAIAIREQGEEALSFTGSQAAIITDEVHTAARIEEVRGGRVREELERGNVVIVAGFQGVSRSREITTLGRGGSDTTAVALAAALEADRCEIYTDVDGVYTADPRRVPDARVIPELSYEEMLELASAGAQVMHTRAVEIAGKFGVDIRVLSSFTDVADSGANGRGGTGGTLITRTPKRMEDLILTGIASSAEQAKIVLRRLPAGWATATEVLTLLAEEGVSVDLISETQDVGGRVQLQLTVTEETLPEALRVCEAAMARLGGEGVESQVGLTRIALIGSGMHDRPGVYARTFRALLEANAEVHALSTSSISITVVIGSEREEEALRKLHSAFELEMEQAARGATCT